MGLLDAFAGLAGAGMNIGAKVASGKTQGLGGDIGSALGSAAGEYLGGSSGAALGKALGGMAGGAGESLARGAGGQPKGARAPTRRQVVKAAKAAHRAGVAPSPKAAAQGMAQTAKVLAQTKKARTAASEAMGAALVGKGSVKQRVQNYGKLATAAGLSKAQTVQAIRRGVTPGALLRQAGLANVANVAGVAGGAAGLAQRMGVDHTLVRAVGLDKAPPRQAAPVAVRRAVANVMRTVRQRAPVERYEVQMSGADDVGPGEIDPRSLTPGISGPARRGGTPGPVPVRPDNWDFDRAEYVLDWGDTLSGLAATYLGGAGRWREIWNEQPTQFRFSRSPDKLQAGERLKMPKAAVANAKAMAQKPGAQVAPNGKVVDVSGEVISLVPTWAKVAVGVGGVAVVGGLIYAASKVL